MIYLACKCYKVISLLVLPDLFLQWKRSGIIASFVTSGIGFLTASVPYCFKTVEAGISFLFQSKEYRTFKLELCCLKLGGNIEVEVLFET